MQPVDPRPWKAVLEQKRIRLTTMALDRAYGCIDCKQLSFGAPHGKCGACGSLNIHSIAQLWEQLKTSVSATGKRRLLLPLPPLHITHPPARGPTGANDEHKTF